MHALVPEYLCRRDLRSVHSHSGLQLFTLCAYEGVGVGGVMLVDGARQGWGKAVTNVILSL